MSGSSNPFAARSQQWRSQRLRRIAWIAGTVLLVALLVWVVLFSSLLSVRQVEVIGADPADRRSVQKTVDQEELGVPLARVGTGGVADRVRTTKGVREVTVTRSWPRTLTVEITPREAALAVQKSKGQVDLMDLDGVVFRRVAKAPKGVPLVRTEGGARVGAKGVAAARSVVSALPADLRDRVSDIRVDDADSVSFTVGGTRVVWGDGADAERKTRLVEILLKKKAKTVDVSAPDTPVTRD